MDSKLMQEILELQKGDHIKINNRTFTIQQKWHQLPQDHYDTKITSFKLNHDHVLEHRWDKFVFFEIVRKKGLFFMNKKSRYKDIDKIEI